MTEISPEVQALIDEALERQRQELAAPRPAPTSGPLPSSPEPPVRTIKHSKTSAAAVGREDEFAAEMEVLRRPVQVEFRGAIFDCPPPDVWLVDFEDHMRGGAVKPALTLALGKDGYARFRALDPAPGMIDHLALANRIGEAVKAGE